MDPVIATTSQDWKQQGDQFEIARRTPPGCVSHCQEVVSRLSASSPRPLASNAISAGALLGSSTSSGISRVRGEFSPQRFEHPPSGPCV